MVAKEETWRGDLGEAARASYLAEEGEPGVVKLYSQTF